MKHKKCVSNIDKKFRKVIDFTDCKLGNCGLNLPVKDLS